MNVVLTGTGLALPTAICADDLLGAGGPPMRGPAPAGALRRDGTVATVDPAALVGRKGLRYKDRATQLAYCAVDLALRDAGLLTVDGLTVAPSDVGVVASSNLGNADTVVSALETLTAGGSTATSPMDLPNASSNVVATSTAIRFSLRGPNLMLCNGAASGIDAVHWARTIIRSGRARHVVVVGVEPDNRVTRQLLGGPALDGAATVVLEDGDTAARRGARVVARIGRYLRTAGLRECVESLASAPGDRALDPDAPDDAGAWFLPQSAAEPRADVLLGVDRWRADPRWGYAGGAFGVIQCIWAGAWLAREGDRSVLLTAGDDEDDATAGLLLHRTPAVPT
jgi:3-oxoacyl-[acyl-carrier-protein] synthase II